MTDSLFDPSHSVHSHCIVTRVNFIFLFFCTLLILLSFIYYNNYGMLQDLVTCVSKACQVPYVLCIHGSTCICTCTQCTCIIQSPTCIHAFSIQYIIIMLYIHSCLSSGWCCTSVWGIIVCGLCRLRMLLLSSEYQHAIPH